MLNNLTLIGLLTLISVTLAISPATSRENETIRFTFVPEWGDPFNEVGQYVIQPWDYPGNIYRFPMDAAI